MGRRAKLWRKAVGAYGHTVTALERRAGGPLYLRWWDPGRAPAGNWVHRCLGHTDRTRAEEQARALAGEILAAQQSARAGRAPLALLLARYLRDVSAHKRGAQPSEDRRRAEIWTFYLGGQRDARSVDRATMHKFERDRRAGRIRLLDAEGEPRLSPNPSDSTIGADIVFLMSVLNWATSVTLEDGTRLLAENPLRGYERPRSKNPRRPLATYDRFVKVRAKADAVDPQRLFGAFLDLVEALGWRVSAICQLRGTDVDRAARPAAPHGRVHKRSDTDKEGADMWVPLSESARAALDRIPVIGDRYLFPAPGNPHAPKSTGPPKPWSRWHARDLLRRAEAAAELEPLEGGNFHPYRRAWATARKHLPNVDVAAAGGWRDLRSLERCYTQVDPETMFAVVSEPRKVREAKEAQIGR